MTKWYTAECRRLEKRCEDEYTKKESTQEALKNFYTARQRREHSSDPAVRQQEAQDRRMHQAKERAIKSATDGRPELRDMPDYRSAEVTY